jgi:hypothetical protein
MLLIMMSEGRRSLQLQLWVPHSMVQVVKPTGKDCGADGIAAPAELLNATDQTSSVPKFIQTQVRADFCLLLEFIVY